MWLFQWLWCLWSSSHCFLGWLSFKMARFPCARLCVDLLNSDLYSLRPEFRTFLPRGTGLAISGHLAALTIRTCATIHSQLGFLRLYRQAGFQPQTHDKVTCGYEFLSKMSNVPLKKIRLKITSKFSYPPMWNTFFFFFLVSFSAVNVIFWGSWLDTKVWFDFFPFRAGSRLYFHVNYLNWNSAGRGGSRL